MLAIFSTLFGLLAMLSYGFANAYAKPLSRKLNISHLIYLRGCTLVLILGIAAIPHYHNLSHWQVALATLGLGMAGYLPVQAFTQAIKRSPLGIVSPISSTSTLITVLLSVLFLHVTLHTTQWADVGVIVVANFVLSADLKNWRQPKHLNLSRGVLFALASAFGFGLFYFFLIPAAKVLGPWLASFLLELGITIVAAWHIKLSSDKILLKEVTKTLSPAVALNGTLIGLGTVTYTIGVKYFNIGIVSALSSSSAMVTTLAGAYIFHERLRAKDKLAAAVAIVCIIILPAL